MAPVSRPVTGAAGLKLTDLHPSLSDPVLDSMTFLNEVTQRYPAAISFAPGRPYEQFFDPAQISRLIDTYLDSLRARGYTEPQVRRTLLQYGDTAGLIRRELAAMLQIDEGISVAPESIVVTVGCQEAILLSLRALFSGPGDVLLVDSPCYVGVTGAARLLQIPVVAVPGGDDGLDLAELERTVRQLTEQGLRPRALYVVPDCSNPSGTSMPTANRTELLAAAATYDLLVLEDNPYGLFSETPRPTLKSLDTDQRVIYLGSMAKSAFPGARIGYVVADQPVLGGAAGEMLASHLSKIKSMVTVNTPSISQALIGGLLLDNGGGLRAANAVAARHYQQSMRCLREALSRAFPPLGTTGPRVTWNHPDGGFFLTLTVPFPADEAALRRSAERYEVIWSPMRYFHLDDRGHQQIRLSCSYLSTDEITEGVDRLAAFITEQV
jgi:(S)-3,5-dihydroxyphenylglycine transaminase